MSYVIALLTDVSLPGGKATLFESGMRGGRGARGRGAADLLPSGKRGLSSPKEQSEKEQKFKPNTVPGYLIPILVLVICLLAGGIYFVAKELNPNRIGAGKREDVQDATPEGHFARFIYEFDMLKSLLRKVPQ